MKMITKNKYSIFRRIWWKVSDWLKRHQKDTGGCPYCDGECENY